VIDVAWPDELVLVEFDGYRPHSGRTAFDDDRVRQNELVRAGWVPFRLTSTALTADPDAAFAPIAEVVRARRRESA
jgi:very-short-patch-repair endonuclease